MPRTSKRPWPSAITVVLDVVMPSPQVDRGSEIARARVGVGVGEGGHHHVDEWLARDGGDGLRHKVLRGRGIGQREGGPVVTPATEAVTV